jgi:hypothetical protein
MTRKKTQLFLAAALVALGLTSKAQDARVQVVHNAPNAPAVDIYVNANKVLTNVPFRAASSFLNVPSGVPLQVRIKPTSTQADTSNPVFFRTYTLAASTGYYLIANGNLGTTQAPNPEGIPTGFDITVIPDAKSTSALPGNVDLRIFHGVTDAPTVDIKAQGVATLVENAPFRGFSGYIPVPAASYTIQIAPGSGSPNLLAYNAPLTGLAGSSLLVLASGYFNPAANQVNGQNGPAFGIWAFTPTGQAIQLPKAISRVQIVHNSASAPAVDVFVNGGKAVPGLDFRKATPFVNLDAGVPLTVALKGASASTDTSNPAFRQTYELAGGESYTLVATGLLSTTGYAANPDGIATGFDITILPGAREIASTSTTSNNAEVRVLHACTDAPFVDVRVQGGATLVNNAGFRNFTSYLGAPNVNLNLEVTDSAQAGVVATFLAPLGSFPDSAMVVMASGFLTPSANQNGPGFGLLAVLPSGTAVLLPAVTSVKDARKFASFEAFPNPGQNQITMRLPEGQMAAKAEAISVTGQRIQLELNNTTGKLDVSDLKAGIYLVNIQTQTGTFLQAKVQIL